MFAKFVLVFLANSHSEGRRGENQKSNVFIYSLFPFKGKYLLIKIRIALIGACYFLLILFYMHFCL